MYHINDFFGVLNEVAPIELSYKCIDKGDYDNSGILVKCRNEIEKVLFSLDLSQKSVDVAKSKQCDTIVTHHPAIYMPIKNLSKDDSVTAPVLFAIENEFNVISMHLNLDIAQSGIDYSLAKIIGATNEHILTEMDEGCGYGREYELNATLGELVKNIKIKLATEKIIMYGDENYRVKKAGSFCGGGSSYALNLLHKNVLAADTIITSDMPHHAIREFVESGKNVILIPHYVAEEYGFKKFYEQISAKLNGIVKTVYFADKRFI